MKKLSKKYILLSHFFSLLVPLLNPGSRADSFEVLLKELARLVLLTLPYHNSFDCLLQLLFLAMPLSLLAMPQLLIIVQPYNTTIAHLFDHLDLLTTVEVNIVLPAVSRLVLVWEISIRNVAK